MASCISYSDLVYVLPTSTVPNTVQTVNIPFNYCVRVCDTQGTIQDLLYVPVDFAAYEHCTKYCPDCDYEFPSVYMEGGAEYNDSYGAAYEDEEGMGIGYVDKKHGGGVMLPAKIPVEGETMFVSEL